MAESAKQSHVLIGYLSWQVSFISCCLESPALVPQGKVPSFLPDSNPLLTASLCGKYIGLILFFLPFMNLNFVSVYKMQKKKTWPICIPLVNNTYFKVHYMWATFFCIIWNIVPVKCLILITIVRSFTNSLSRTSLNFSLKTSFVYSNLFSLAKTVKC